MLTEIAAIDQLLSAHVRELGADLSGYRNHVYRVANFCVALSGASGERLAKTAIAAAAHDLGIWTDRTFDYLDSSVRVARDHLVKMGRSEWAPEIERMILEHHKLSRSLAPATSLVEPFRRADWIDVSRGVFRFGLPAAFVAEVMATWPNSGFHRRLVQLALLRARTNPLSPLPMVRV